jgi:hypothetical protein
MPLRTLASSTTSSGAALQTVPLVLRTLLFCFGFVKEFSALFDISG